MKITNFAAMAYSLQDFGMCKFRYRTIIFVCEVGLFQVMF